MTLPYLEKKQSKIAIENLGGYLTTKIFSGRLSLEDQTELVTPNLITRTQAILKLSSSLIGSKLSFYVNDPDDGRKKYDKVIFSPIINIRIIMRIATIQNWNLVVLQTKLMLSNDYVLIFFI